MDGCGDIDGYCYFRSIFLLFFALVFSSFCSFVRELLEIVCELLAGIIVCEGE